MADINVITPSDDEDHDESSETENKQVVEDTSESSANEESTNKDEEFHGLEPESTKEETSEHQSDADTTSEESKTEPEVTQTTSDNQDTAPVVITTDPVVTDKKSRLPKGGMVTDKLPKSNLQTMTIAVLGVAVILLAVACLSLKSDNTTLKKDNTNLNNQVVSINANPQALVQQQTNDLLTKVGKLTTLPTSETPTIAVVSDVNAARLQSPFFKNAQNGDKVLMYVKAGEAVLYRPTTNKVILVAPLTLTNSTTTTK